MLKKFVDFFLIVLVLIYILFEELFGKKIAKPIVRIITRLLSKFNFFEDFLLKIEKLNSYKFYLYF